MKAWMGIAAAMAIGVGTPGLDRVVPLPVYAAEQATEQAAKVLADMRKALGGAKLDQVKAVSVEGPFRRQMGPREMEGTTVLVLQGPDKMHKSEENVFPGGMSVERILALSGDTSWTDTQNRGGMGGGMQVIMRDGPPGAPGADPAEAEKRRTTQLKSEMQRWMFALLGTPTGEVTYAGVAESPDGKADTIEMKDARGQALRLFVDQETHMPLMLAYQDMRPRIMMRGGPGGPGGPGGRRGSQGPGPAPARARLQGPAPKAQAHRPLERLRSPAVAPRPAAAAVSVRVPRRWSGAWRPCRRPPRARCRCASMSTPPWTA